MPLTRFCPGTFLSTLSLRRATQQGRNGQNIKCDFYPRSPCGERPGKSNKLARQKLVFLSTLSLRRATCRQGRNTPGALPISIHALLAESDPSRRYPAIPGREISIHALLAESDLESSRAANCQQHFYPRSPCGERPPYIYILVNTFLISIHALLAESDRGESPRRCVLSVISIHALLAESDLRQNQHQRKQKDISIHALLAESDPIWSRPKLAD